MLVLLEKGRTKIIIICWSNPIKCTENTLIFFFFFQCNYCHRGSGQQTWKRKDRRKRRKRRREKREREFQPCWKKTRSERLEAADLELRLHAGKLFSFLSQHFWLPLKYCSTLKLYQGLCKLWKKKCPTHTLASPPSPPTVCCITCMIICIKKLKWRQNEVSNNPECVRYWRF